MKKNFMKSMRKTQLCSESSVVRLSCFIYLLSTNVYLVSFRCKHSDRLDDRRENEQNEREKKKRDMRCFTDSYNAHL